MDAVTSKRQKNMSQRQERQVAEDIGGRTVAGSGAGRTSGGGDVRLRSEFRVECKVTEKPFFVLQHTVLRKIRDQAINGGMEQPVLQVRFAVPRSMEFEIAITPSEYDSSLCSLHTDRKRIRLTLSDLQYRLLNHVVIVLSINKELWDIKYWSTFLADMERSRADNQHNSRLL